MRRVYIVLGILVFVAPLFLYNQKLKELNVDINGKLVKMRIIDKPFSCLGTKAKHFMKVEYQQVVYLKQISSNFCEDHHIGDIIELKYLKNSNALLFENESVAQDIYAGAFISLMGLLSVIYYGFIKKYPQ